MAIRFGTDGVRGLANQEITPEVALALGRAVPTVFDAREVFIGIDTRRSGPMLEAAVSAGVQAVGARSSLLGVVPTPAVALVSQLHDAPGIMISASHNAFPDNGLKVFGPGGSKLTDAEQHRLEVLLGQFIEDPSSAPAPIGEDIGDTRNFTDAVALYQKHVVAALDGRDLSGLRIVVDAANGSNCTIGPAVLTELGAEVITIGDQPTGVNINEACGSTHPEQLAALVVEHQADLGLAFDGDADRLVAIDHAGTEVDGDFIIAICALDFAQNGKLKDHTVAVTVMSNLGFRLAMQKANIAVVETPVGDRHILEALTNGGWSLGGEQSGHIIFRDLATTGDGLLSAVILADVVKRSSSTLADLAKNAMEQLPQVLINVTVDQPAAVVEAIAAEVEAAEQRLGETGRVLLRASGTEPVVRVMVEAADKATAQDIAEELAQAVATRNSAVG